MSEDNEARSQDYEDTSSDKFEENQKNALKNQGKHSPARFGKVEDFKEILAEIGKVALECLLKDDHVFEYDQLSAAILCEESLIIGLLQVSEYAENLQPAGMVSFIHKSIQEFLARGTSPTDVSLKEISVELKSTPPPWKIVRPWRMFFSSFVVCLTMEQ
ncbi:Nlrc4p [Desmophyllum pertusum]|uniref:Nlrc4p n=1 Tax=Desmophyllum pertusum TaxID=174260 RepID=A0A9W9YZB0_9CNID|nr:Nlrc4p [Desmophyllum pertusum]